MLVFPVRINNKMKGACVCESGENYGCSLLNMIHLKEETCINLDFPLRGKQLQSLIFSYFNDGNTRSEISPPKYNQLFLGSNAYRNNTFQLNPITNE